MPNDQFPLKAPFATTPARLQTLVVCHFASLAFHHSRVSRSWRATSTVPMRTLSVTLPLIHAGLTAARTLSCAGAAIVTTGTVESPTTGDTPGSNTLMRSFSASATYSLPALSCEMPEGLENWYGPWPFVPHFPRKFPFRSKAWMRLSLESVTYRTPFTMSASHAYMNWPSPDPEEPKVVMGVPSGANSSTRSVCQLTV